MLEFLHNFRIIHAQLNIFNLEYRPQDGIFINCNIYYELPCGYLRVNKPKKIKVGPGP